MPAQEFNTFDAYETFIKTSIKPWSAAQRSALTAAMAERWLPAYESFAKAEDWGDPALLRQALTAVWKTLTPSAAPLNWKRLSSQIHAVTPHMDDFDANEALCACVMLQYAIDCLQQRDNNTAALMGVLSGLEAVSPDILELDRVPARVWRNSVIRQEIEQQLRLIAAVQAAGPSADFYDALQPLWSDPAMVGQIQPQEASPARWDAATRSCTSSTAPSFSWISRARRAIWIRAKTPIWQRCCTWAPGWDVTAGASRCSPVNTAR